MSILVLVLVLVALLLLAGAVVAAVRHDGYGSVPPPRSHVGWDEASPFGARLV